MQLENTTALIEGAPADGGQVEGGRSFFGGNLAKRGYVVHLDEEHRFLASPSITRLPSGRLLLLYEKCVDAPCARDTVFATPIRVWKTDLTANRRSRLSPAHLVCCIVHFSYKCRFVMLQHFQHNRSQPAPELCRGFTRRRQASWGFSAPETGYKYVHASDDGGRSWQHVGLPGPMQWPQIFTCASGASAIPPCMRYSTMMCFHFWSPLPSLWLSALGYSLLYPIPY